MQAMKWHYTFDGRSSACTRTNAGGDSVLFAHVGKHMLLDVDTVFEHEVSPSTTHMHT